MWCTLLTVLPNLLISNCYVAVSFYTKMAMFGQRFYRIIKIIKYFFVARFLILRSGDWSDELHHTFLLQGISGPVMSQDVITVLQVDQSWANSTVLDVLTSVPDYEECRALCRVLINI